MPQVQHGSPAGSTPQGTCPLCKKWLRARGSRPQRRRPSPRRSSVSGASCCTARRRPSRRHPPRPPARRATRSLRWCRKAGVGCCRQSSPVHDYRAPPPT
eukprot:Mycagemm_TRINITY_DN10284_c0_g2::TRINITY_DN10284_c0_g2_i1::g.3974::m.3974 type:complete len:100 gc:universal TRINITY_DN10284_c0_g2_i1:317-616(+)